MWAVLLLRNFGANGATSIFSNSGSMGCKVTTLLTTAFLLSLLNVSLRATELSAEQSFWSRYLVQSEEPNLSSSTTLVEVPKKLPKVSMAVEQHCVEKNKFQVKMKNVLKDNERLLEQAICVDIVNIVVHDHVNSACKTVNTELSAEQSFWSRYLVQSEEPNLSSSTTLVEVPKKLPKVSMIRLGHHVVQVNLNSKQKLMFLAHLDRAHYYTHYLDYILVVEIDVGGMTADVVDKVTCSSDDVQPKQVDLKCAHALNELHWHDIHVVPDRHKVDQRLIIASLRGELRKLKGKDAVDNVVTSQTIAPKMLTIDVEPVAPKLLKNRTVHSDYLRHTQEQDAILKEVVEQGKSQNPLNNSLDHACYGDYQIGNIKISRVYYVEGLRHNLFSIGQFCDSNLEVAFRQHTCFIRNLDGVDLLTGSRGNNLYTLSMGDMMASSPICLLSKASKTKSSL
nr:integrase, catalytic region, zinc finger, CCHC-type, peptidase aspartic, catalytic [Tanacetum cinerariifolium]